MSIGVVTAWNDGKTKVYGNQALTLPHGYWVGERVGINQRNTHYWMHLTGGNGRLSWDLKYKDKLRLSNVLRFLIMLEIEDGGEIFSDAIAE